LVVRLLILRSLLLLVAATILVATSLLLILLIAVALGRTRESGALVRLLLRVLIVGFIVGGVSTLAQVLLSIVIM
jgi:hypothetical protein